MTFLYNNNNSKNWQIQTISICNETKLKITTTHTTWQYSWPLCGSTIGTVSESSNSNRLRDGARKKGAQVTIIEHILDSIKRKPTIEMYV